MSLSVPSFLWYIFPLTVQKQNAVSYCKMTVFVCNTPWLEEWYTKYKIMRAVTEYKFFPGFKNNTSFHVAKHLFINSLLKDMFICLLPFWFLLKDLASPVHLSESCLFLIGSHRLHVNTRCKQSLGDDERGWNHGKQKLAAWEGFMCTSTFLVQWQLSRVGSLRHQATAASMPTSTLLVARWHTIVMTVSTSTPEQQWQPCVWRMAPGVMQHQYPDVYVSFVRFEGFSV